MLQELKQQAYYAFQGTSFSPEKRAESSIKEHTENVRKRHQIFNRIRNLP